MTSKSLQLYQSENAVYFCRNTKIVPRSLSAYRPNTAKVDLFRPTTAATRSLFVRPASSRLVRPTTAGIRSYKDDELLRNPFIEEESVSVTSGSNTELKKLVRPVTGESMLGSRPPTSTSYPMEGLQARGDTGYSTRPTTRGSEGRPGTNRSNKSVKFSDNDGGVSVRQGAQILKISHSSDIPETEEDNLSKIIN